MAVYNVFYKKTKKFLFPLFGITLLSLFINLYIFISMLVYHYDASYLAFPIVSCVITILFLVYQLVVNIKMRYTLPVLIIYCAIVLLTPFILFVNTIFVRKTYIITNYMLNTYIIVSVLTFLFTIASLQNKILYNKIAKIIATVLCCSLYFAVILFNVISIGQYGIFGQGKDNSAIIYELQDDNTLLVRDVVHTKNEKVSIPDYFNGKEITKLDCTIFDKSVDVVEMKGNFDNLEFLNIDKIDCEENFELRFNKKVLVKFKDKLYKTKSEKSTLLANSIIPLDLTEEETYVNFNYDFESLKLANYNTIPSWIGKKGSKLNISSYSNLDYIDHSNNRSDEDLLWNYNNNGYIIKTNVSNDITVNDSKNIDINFEKIYCVKITEDNDNIFEADIDDKSIVVDGTRHNFILATADGINDIFTNFPKRDGFTLSWYNEDVNVQDMRQYIVSKDSLETTFKPVWTLNNPRIVDSVNMLNTITYGNKYEDNIDVKPASNDFDLMYKIYNSKDQVLYSSDSTQLSINGLKPTDSGQYKLSIESSTSGSSLKNIFEVPFNILIDKKIVNFDWVYDADNIYSATNKNVQVNFDNTQLEYSDTLDYNILYNNQKAHEFNIKNAGQYAFELKLENNMNNCYEIANNCKSLNYSIQPKHIEVVWSNNEFIYNGTPQSPKIDSAPTYTSDTTAINYTYSEAKKDVGSYTCNATINSNNYIVDNKTIEYDILPKN